MWDSDCMCHFYLFLFKHSWKPGQKLQPSLDKLLWDKSEKCVLNCNFYSLKRTCRLTSFTPVCTEYLAAFSSFLQTEFSEENVDFWSACEDFKKTISLDELQDKAQRIYREFLEPTAKREVSLLETTGG